MNHSKSQLSGLQDHQRQTQRKRIGRGHNLPVCFFVLWLICEFSPSIIPASISDETYWMLYFLSEDLTGILLALACYTALSYTSTILKAMSLTAVVIACGLMLANASIEFLDFDESTATGLMVAFVLISLQLFMTRFVFRMDHTYTTPEPSRIYLIVTKPHDLWGMAGLFWSGIGGGFSVYVDGTCYWFSREAGVMVKEYDLDYYKTRQLIDCGIATKDKIEDLDNLVGCKWSIWNNCFTVFGRWRRAWSED